MHPATTPQPDPHGKDAAVIDWTGELLDQLDGPLTGLTNCDPGWTG